MKGSKNAHAKDSTIEARSPEQDIQLILIRKRMKRDRKLEAEQYFELKHGVKVRVTDTTSKTIKSPSIKYCSKDNTSDDQANHTF